MLDDSHAKVARANENLSALGSLIAAFKSEAHRVHMEPEFWTEPVESWSADVIVWAEATSEPPSRYWGAIIGDIVHGFRSALDQLAWELSVSHQAAKGVVPPAGRIPWGDPWRDIWFPICLTPNAWEGVASKHLWAMDPALVASLKPLQPFCTGKDAPEREPLAVLQELWNIDKHRHLHLVNATVELVDVVSVNPFPDLPPDPLTELEFKIVSQRGPGPLVGRAEVGRASFIRKPGGLVAVSHPHMHMEPDIAVDVAFEEGYPAYGGGVLHTLGQIRETVEAILYAV